MARCLIAPHVKLMRQVRCVADLSPAVEPARAVERDGVPGPTFAECPVRTAGVVEGALARARELAAAGRPVLVNVWLDRTDFRERSLSI